jgi:2-polyprenyl-3-methyl-5-hydroxy-6-metoxy-1,4-benzoquinol methylase
MSITTANCRFCAAPLKHTFCDLGMSPLSNSYLDPAQLNQSEKFYPLHAMVCDQCFLVQLQEFESPETIFSDYAYFSSYSSSWLEHAKTYVDMIISRCGLGAQSHVVELASNDGYLLKNFVSRGIPVTGVEPAANVAAVAKEKGVNTLVRFFGAETAREMAASGRHADLLLGNNVIAHVPDINDFVSGMKILLEPEGVITLEFPSLLELIQGNQFDTIYHEHFSYLSFSVVERIFSHHGITIFDVEKLSTHGGSLRVYGRHANNTVLPLKASVGDMRALEAGAGFSSIDTYTSFMDNVHRTKRRILTFLVDAKDRGKRIACYGAAAKGNTLLNYCGIRDDFIDYVVDSSPHKQGRFLPGTHLSIFGPEKLAETRPDYVVLLPWNLQVEIIKNMGHIREWGGRFVTFIPTVEVID